MSNAKLIGLISLFYIVISEMSLSLGLTTYVIARPDGLTDMGDISVFEILLRLPIWVFNAFASIFQLAFFTTDIPVLISSVVFLPIVFILVYIGIVTVRGGAG